MAIVPPEDPPLVESMIGFDEFPDPAEFPSTPSDRALILGLTIDFDIPSGGDCANILGAASRASYNDRDLLIELKYHLIEPTPGDPTVFAEDSDLWTLEEVLGYLNQRQYQFLRDTGLVMKRSSITSPPESFRHQLPSDVIAIQAVWWRDTGIEVHESQRFIEVRRGDGWEADALLPAWPSTLEQKPLIYMDAEVPTLQLQTAPPVFSGGVLDLLYVGLSTLLTGEEVDFAIPSEYVPGLKWGVLADLLSKIGRGHDPIRAAHAESRYQEVVEAAKLLLSGFA